MNVATAPLKAVPASWAGMVAGVIVTDWSATVTVAESDAEPTPAGAVESVTVTVSV